VVDDFTRTPPRSRIHYYAARASVKPGSAVERRGVPEPEGRLHASATAIHGTRNRANMARTLRQLIQSNTRKLDKIGGGVLG